MYAVATVIPFMSQAAEPHLAKSTELTLMKAQSLCRAVG